MLYSYNRPNINDVFIEAIYIMKLWNETKKRMIVYRLEYARTYWERMKGLLGKKEYPNAALFIEPCFQVHTWFMRFTMDVLFVNEQNEVIAKAERLTPWSISKKYDRAKAVIEAEAGTFSDEVVRIGDMLRVIKVEDDE